MPEPFKVARKASASNRVASSVAWRSASFFLAVSVLGLARDSRCKRTEEEGVVEGREDESGCDGDLPSVGAGLACGWREVEVEGALVRRRTGLGLVFPGWVRVGPLVSRGESGRTITSPSEGGSGLPLP